MNDFESGESTQEAPEQEEQGLAERRREIMRQIGDEALTPGVYKAMVEELGSSVTGGPHSSKRPGVNKPIPGSNGPGYKVPE